ncbi:hypothetical protein SPSIL_032660 [Sporomusa silvacetica DSM 10669]|uniref:FG-GAP repeat protein n=1 Tax=Sporomusa silvacetica DSM 10669 TaxID=1123289 RepID=A0ABZ3IN35_9FIRM|nr:hypothetical protein [Sporomusa silvacetica]OZC18023.1 hypothetical protein SPSIL_28220 [Sporomusa silvacetica DSM 10669]
MKIASSTIAMTSQHSLVEQDVQQESLQVWSGGEADPQTRPTPKALLAVPQDLVDISDQAKQMSGVQTAEAEPFELSDKDKQKLQLIQDFIQMITGKKIKLLIPTKELNLKPTVNQASLFQGQQISVQGQANLGWGLRYSSYQGHSEKESVAFGAAGVVRTADGQEINFSVQLNMTRQFMSEQSINIKAGDALKDPLVINFDAPAAKLTPTKYSFDIDSDGVADQISFTGPGSGFLALDANGDGKINNGQELFGPESGNGFSDLAAYDSDGNNWIDENDAIYEKLRIWTKDDQGNDQLLALGQKGVGAIYLGHVSTEFAMKDSTNQQLGQLRSTGVFLRENGTVGTLQQVDLAV